MSITADNMIEVTNLKAGQRVVQVDGKWVAVGVGGAKASGITGTSGSMEIYKCADADGLTWWVVSGCGSAEANGRYYQGDDIASEYGGSHSAYYQQNGSCSLMYDAYNGYWVLKSGSTNLYRDESYNYYNGDPSQCTGWVIDSGVTPVPTIAKETTTGNGWSGLKYDTETGEVAEEVTELEYTAQMPEIGKLYTYDATLQITDKGGLLLYAPCAEYGKEIKWWSNGDKAQMNYTNISEANFTTLKGVPCLLGTGSQTAYAKISYSNMTSFTASCMFYSTQNQSNYQTPAGLGTFESNTLNPIHFAVHYPSGKYYIGDSLRDPYDELYFDLLLETWTHVTVAVNVDGTYGMYINGVLQDSGMEFYTPTQQFEYLTLLALTQTATASGTKYKGAVAEVKLWGKALSPEEIKAEADRCLKMVTE